jgi:hypothetical protein
MTFREGLALGAVLALVLLGCGSSGSGSASSEAASTSAINRNKEDLQPQAQPDPGHRERDATASQGRQPGRICPPVGRALKGVDHPERLSVLGSGAGHRGVLIASADSEERTPTKPKTNGGIAQFIPSTAASYGLADPYDPLEAIDAEAHMMSDLIRRFGSLQLALAAYNAGPAPVEACHCVPSNPETTA